MFFAEAKVESDKASSYLVQLGKHFAHKVPTEYDETRGRVEFEPGLCTLRASGNVLSVRCEAKTYPELQSVKGIIQDHLVRFAWRENIAMNWSDGAPDLLRNDSDRL
jgi:hypothetical protein